MLRSTVPGGNGVGVGPAVGVCVGVWVGAAVPGGVGEEDGRAVAVVVGVVGGVVRGVAPGVAVLGNVVAVGEGRTITSTRDIPGRNILKMRNASSMGCWVAVILDVALGGIVGVSVVGAAIGAVGDAVIATCDCADDGCRCGCHAFAGAPPIAAATAIVNASTKGQRPIRVFLDVDDTSSHYRLGNHLACGMGYERIRDSPT